MAEPLRFARVLPYRFVGFLVPSASAERDFGTATYEDDTSENAADLAEGTKTRRDCFARGGLAMTIIPPRFT